MLKIKELRESLNLTQNELATKLGYARTCISSRESGRTEPSIKDLNKLAELFGCSVDYLLGREDDFGVVSTSKNLNLTSNESEILSHFRLLSADLQREAIGFVKALAY